MPKATFTRRAGELAFYGAFFQNRRVEWCRDWDRMERIAIEEACQLGLGAADALHLAAALLLGADELVTTERPTKPIFRSRLVRVSYLYASQT